MTLFRIKKNDGSLDLPILEKAIETLLRISDQSKLQRETSNTQDSDAGKYGGLVPPQNIELTSYRESAGVTLAPNATVKASWAPVAGASYYDVELDTNESEGQGAYNKEARSNSCFWQNMTLGITVKLRVRSCNSAYKSEWSEVLEKQVINGSYTSVGPLVITAKKLFRWVHASVPKINRRLYRQHRGYEWQWANFMGFVPIEKETTQSFLFNWGIDYTINRKITFSNHAVFRVASLTRQVYVRVRAFDSDNNKTAWSDEYSVLEEVPAEIESLEVEALPLHVGFFKRVQWRLNVEWVWSVPTGGDPDMNGSFEIQYRRGTTGLWTRHFVDLDPADDPADKSGEHNISLAFPPKNVTPANGYVPGEYTNLYVRIRARENLIPGAWFPAAATYPNGLQVAFVAADDADTCPTPTATFEYLPGGILARDIIVNCCEGTYDFPNSFSHFSVHARVKDNELGTWAPDTTTYRDMVCPVVHLEKGVSGVTLLVPWFLFKDSAATFAFANKAIVWPAEIESHVEIKAVPWCWEQA